MNLFPCALCMDNTNIDGKKLERERERESRGWIMDRFLGNTNTLNQTQVKDKGKSFVIRVYLSVSFLSLMCGIWLTIGFAV